MTVQDFIVNYSATFEYLHKRYGKAAVVALWQYLGETNTKRFCDCCAVSAYHA